MTENIPHIYQGILVLVAVLVVLVIGMAVDRAKHRNQPRCGPGCRRELESCELTNKKLKEMHEKALNFAYQEVARHKIRADKLEAQLAQART